MTLQEQQELLYLTRENYKMLRYICEKINIHESNFDRENQDDFIRNILANLIGDGLIKNNR